MYDLLKVTQQSNGWDRTRTLDVEVGKAFVVVVVFVVVLTITNRDTEIVLGFLNMVNIQYEHYSGEI